MTDWRNLPVLTGDELLPQPEKLSQTILDRETRCPRSALLYLKHRGGPSSLEMERGNAFHEFAQQAIHHLIEVDEPALPPEVAKDLMQGVLDDPRFVVPAGEADALRVAAYHFAEGFSVEPSSVVAVEQMFEYDTPDGLTLRGKLDLAFTDGDTICVRDFKSGHNYPSAEEFEGSFQQPFYAVLVAFGVPVTKTGECEACQSTGATGLPAGFAENLSPDALPLEPGFAFEVHGDPRDLVIGTCEVCHGDGAAWERGLPLGDRANMFDLAEVYPWLEVREDGLAKRQMFLSRPELIDHKAYAEGVAAKLAGRFDSGDFPAIPGTACSTCAAKPECPIPAALRDFRGVVDSEELAVTALAWSEFQASRVKQVRAEVRQYAKREGPVRVGDEVWEFQDEEAEEWITGKRIGRPDSAAARDQMLEAIDRAVRFGETFEYSEFRRRRRSTPFRKRKLSAEEKRLAPEPVTVGERFGDDPPW